MLATEQRDWINRPAARHGAMTSKYDAAGRRAEPRTLHARVREFSAVPGFGIVVAAITGGDFKTTFMEIPMPRKSSKKTQEVMQTVMHEFKEGELKSGKSGKTVTSRKQAIAIGLSEARKKGAKVPAKQSS